MRNKLAHEMVSLSFKQSDLIELLPFKQLERESFSILQNFDLRKMDDMTQYIASYVVLMRKLIKKLSPDMWKAASQMTTEQLPTARPFVRYLASMTAIIYLVKYDLPNRT